MRWHTTPTLSSVLNLQFCATELLVKVVYLVCSEQGHLTESQSITVQTPHTQCLM